MYIHTYSTTMVAIILQSTSLNAPRYSLFFFPPLLFSPVYYIKDWTINIYITATKREVVYSSTSPNLLILCILHKWGFYLLTSQKGYKTMKRLVFQEKAARLGNLFILVEHISFTASCGPRNAEQEKLDEAWHGCLSAVCNNDFLLE